MKIAAFLFFWMLIVPPLLGKALAYIFLASAWVVGFDPFSDSRALDIATVVLWVFLFFGFIFIMGLLEEEGNTIATLADKFFAWVFRRGEK